MESGTEQHLWCTSSILVAKEQLCQGTGFIPPTPLLSWFCLKAANRRKKPGQRLGHCYANPLASHQELLLSSQGLLMKGSPIFLSHYINKRLLSVRFFQYQVLQVWKSSGWVYSLSSRNWSFFPERSWIFIIWTRLLLSCWLLSQIRGCCLSPNHIFLLSDEEKTLFFVVFPNLNACWALCNTKCHAPSFGTSLHFANSPLFLSPCLWTVCFACSSDTKTERELQKETEADLYAQRNPGLSVLPSSSHFVWFLLFLLSIRHTRPKKAHGREPKNWIKTIKVVSDGVFFAFGGTCIQSWVL